MARRGSNPYVRHAREDDTDWIEPEAISRDGEGETEEGRCIANADPQEETCSVRGQK
jgi:hypothetical protein